MEFAVYITTYQKPNKGSLPLLKRSLDSIKSQTYTNYRLYVIGDAYEDQSQIEQIRHDVESTGGYFFNVSESYGRVHYEDQPIKRWSTGGLNATLHTISKIQDDGLEWVCRLDHDDYWDPDHLRIIYDRLTVARPDVAMVITRGCLGNRILPIESSPSNDYPLSRGAFFHSSTCINFSKIKLNYEDPFKAGANMPGDAWLWVRMQKYLKLHGFRAVYVPKITLHRDSEGVILHE